MKNNARKTKIKAGQPAGAPRRAKLGGGKGKRRGEAPRGRKREKRREGRPSILRDATPRGRKFILKQVQNYAMMGATEAEIAAMMNVDPRTIARWKEDAEFCQAIKNGKLVADNNVKASLYNQAIGGNVVACIFWMKNRRPDEWKDKHEGTFSGPAETGGKIIVEVVQVKSRKKEEPVESGSDAPIKIDIAQAGKKPGK